mmetsp:Transcript_57662/g.162579  ORF Transcript_57662/g.162579 Transcript_57662/m.162579 type:complete len:250 (+) Transcript_57662:455-1204(+)
MEHRVEIRLCYRVHVSGAAALHLEHYAPRQLPGRLVPDVGDISECRTLLGTLGDSEVSYLDGDFEALFAALLLLFLHPHDLLAEGCHCVLRDLHLLWRTAATLFALWPVRVCPAAAADDEAPVLVGFRSHPVVELLRRDRHHHIGVVVAQLLLNLVFHPVLLELLLLLVDLRLELRVLRMVLRNLVELHVQLRLLTIHLLPGHFDVLHQLHATRIVVPSKICVSKDLIGLADFVEQVHITAFVRVVLDG